MSRAPRVFDQEVLLSEVGWVRRLARSLVADAHLADDLAQDACLAALEASPRTDRPIRGWLATVVRNLLRQSRRREARRRAREERAARPEASDAGADLVERVALQREVVDAVLALEEPYRTAILLRFFEGLPPRRIAERTGVPVATAKSRLARGLARLRRALDDACGGDRRAWLAALFPLAKPPAGVPTLLSGGLLMATKTKVAIGAILLAALSGALWILGAGARSAGDAHASAPTVATSRSPAVRGEAATPEAPPPPPVRKELPAAGAEPAPPQEPPAPVLLRGRVFDSEGRSAAGVEVGFIPRGESPSAGARRTVSRPDGTFEVEPPGSAGRFVGTGPTVAPVLLAIHEPGASRHGPVVVVASSLSLGGRVVDEAGAPVQGVRVEVKLPAGFRARFPEVLDSCVEVEWSAPSGEEGEFALPGAPSVREGTLVASREGFETSRVPSPTSSDGSIEIVLRRPHLGRPSVRGRVVDPRGSPVPDAWVSAGADAVRTDPAGAFVLDLHETPGSASLTALKEGYSPAFFEAPRTPATGLPSWPDSVVLALGDPPLSIGGRVRRADGTPVSNAQVWAEDPRSFGSVEGNLAHLETLLRGGPEAWSVLADAEGRFRLGGLLDRSYALAALDPTSLVLARASTVPAGTEGVELVLPENALHERVYGQVVSRTGRPVAGVHVQVSRVLFRVPGPGSRGEEEGFRGVTRATSSGATTTDPEGRFELSRVPRNGARLSLGGDAVLPAQVAIPDALPPEGIRIVASLRCHLRVELRDARPG
ncbi:MAG: sigma-70 family RNA polymerase sigma factor, partial [Planctomycetes bacterium]|nr:sigma-70 family RNA polymerase sigma factor [Planctomycetota bacterium]